MGRSGDGGSSWKSFPVPSPQESNLKKAVTRDLPGVLLNEIYPAPFPDTSDKEFIELYNPGSAPVNLAGWKIDDILNGGSAPVSLGPENILPPGGFLVLHEKVILNNAGDSVYLLDTQGNIVDSKSYTNARYGKSFGRLGAGGENWVSTDPTPGN